MMAMFSTNEAEGAIPNGTTVEKVVFEMGDAHDIGSRAIVLGSFGPAKVPGFPSMYGYFVAWEDMKNVPVFIAGCKIGLVSAKR